MAKCMCKEPLLYALHPRSEGESRYIKLYPAVCTCDACGALMRLKAAINPAERYVVVDCLAFLLDAVIKGCAWAPQDTHTHTKQCARATKWEYERSGFIASFKWRRIWSAVRRCCGVSRSDSNYRWVLVEFAPRARAKLSTCILNKSLNIFTRFMLA